MIDKPRRLETANFERAEIAVRWEEAADRAAKSGARGDKLRANELNCSLEQADRKIKAIEAEPGPSLAVPSGP
jgi:hypothetical protein